MKVTSEFDGTSKRLPYMHMNLVGPDEIGKIQDDILAMLLGTKDASEEFKEDMCRFASTLDPLGCGEMIGFEGNRLAWIALDLPHEIKAFDVVRGFLSSASCGQKGIFYLSTRPHQATRLLLQRIRHKLSLDDQPKPPSSDIYDVFESGNFNLFVGTIYPLFMDNVTIIARKTAKALRSQDPSTPVDLVTRATNMRLEAMNTSLNQCNKTAQDWLLQYNCTEGTRKESTWNEAEGFWSEMPNILDSHWKDNHCTPGNCDGDCVRCNPCVYFKSGCGRGKIQAPLLYDSQYVPFFQLDEDSKMFNVVGFVQAGTMVIVSKQESKSDRVLGKDVLAGFVSVFIKWDEGLTDEDYNRTYICARCSDNRTSNRCTNCSSMFDLDKETHGFVLANTVCRSCELCHQHPDLRARRGQKKKQDEDDENDKPLLRARDKRAQKLAVLKELWVVIGIPSFILALLRNPPQKGDEPQDYAWKMLGKLNKIFQVKDPEKKKQLGMNVSETKKPEIEQVAQNTEDAAVSEEIKADQETRRKLLAPLMKLWARQGIPPYILALMRNCPPPRDPADRDEAWQMLAKLEKIFKTQENPKEGDGKPTVD